MYFKNVNIQQQVTVHAMWEQNNAIEIRPTKKKLLCEVSYVIFFFLYTNLFQMFSPFLPIW